MIMKPPSFFNHDVPFGTGPVAITAAGVIVGGGVIGVEQTVTGFTFTGSGGRSFSWTVDGGEEATTATYTPTEADDGLDLIRVTDVANAVNSDSDSTPAVTVKYAPPIADPEADLGPFQFEDSAVIDPIDTAAIFTVFADADLSGCTFGLDVGSDPLPDGLSLSTAGEITGTPTTPAPVVTIIVECSNSGGAATVSFDVTIISGG